MTQLTRRILRIAGPDARDFLQGLVTNDVDKVDQGLVYAALLTPQGKYLADFFLLKDCDDILMDTHGAQTDALVQRLGMYKLRADVQISETELHCHCGIGATPEDGFEDPRDAQLGWRAYREAPQQEGADLTALHVAHGVPSSGQELHADTFILEMGFERLNGVDFRKGCYVGQEVTARMKHKTELRKGLARVRLDGSAAPGTEILRDAKPVGVLHTVADGVALAYLRFDRAGDGMVAGEAKVELDARL